MAVMATVGIQNAIGADAEADALRARLNGDLRSYVASSKVNTSLIPNLASSDWKVQVLAKEEAISRVVEVQGNTVLHVGKEFRSDRIIIHGDGVVWVDGTVVCPLIDIRGRGLVVFTENPLNFNGGWILMNSGLVVSKSDNHAGVHFRQGGSLMVDQHNHGEVIVSEGILSLKVGRDQNGDITLKGTSDISNISLGGDLYGTLSSNHDVNLAMQGSIYSDLDVKKNLNLKAKNFYGDSLHVDQGLTAKLRSLGDMKEESVDVKIGFGDVSVREDSHAEVVSVSDFKFKVGQNHKGNIKSEKGHVKATVMGLCEADIWAGGDLFLVADEAKGSLYAGRNGDVSIDKQLESYLYETKNNAILKCRSFWGNIKVGEEANLKAGLMERGDFSHQVQMNRGKLEVTGLNELDVTVTNQGDLSMGENKGVIKIGGNGKVKVAGSSDKAIAITGNGDISIAGHQDGAIYVGSNGKVDVRQLTGQLDVVNRADVVIGETFTKEYVDGGFVVGFGSIQVKGENIVSVESTQGNGALNLKVGGGQTGDLKAAGDLSSSIAGAHDGQVDVDKNWKHSAQSHNGQVDVGGVMEAKVTGNWLGDVAVEGQGGGTSKLTATEIWDSNLIFQCPAEVKAKSMLNRSGDDESLRLKGGLVHMSDDLQAHLASTHAVVVKARRIVGDVHVDEASKIDAIIKGRFNR